MQKTIYLVLFVSLFINALYSQKNIVDSLSNLLEVAREDTTKIDLMVEIARRSPIQEAQKYLNLSQRIAFRNNFNGRIAKVLYTKGELAYYLKEYDNSIEYFSEAARNYTLANESFRVSNCYYNLANIYDANKNNPKLAVEYAEKSYLIRYSLGMIPPACESLTRMAIYNVKLGLIDEAERSINRAQELLLIQNDTVELISLYSAAVPIYGEKEHLEKAQEYATKVIELRKAQNDSIGLGIDLFNLGNVFYLRGNYELAIPYFHEAVSLYKSMDRNDGEAMALVSIGNIRAELGQYDDALNYFNEALEINKKGDGGNIGSKSGIASCYVGIGKTLIKKDSSNLDLGLTYFIRADSIYNSIEDLGGQVKAGQNIGIAYYRKKDYLKAIAVLSQFIGLNNSINSENWSTTALVALGASYLKINDLDNAEKYLLLAESFIARSKKLDGQIELYQLLSELYLAKEDCQESAKYLEKVIEVKDTIYTNDRTSLIVKYDRVFETERNKREMIDQELQIQKGKNLMNILWFIILILLLLSLYYGIRTQHHKKIASVSQKTIEDLERKNAKVLKENKDLVAAGLLRKNTQKKQEEESKDFETLLNSEIQLFDNLTYKYRDIVYFEKDDDAIFYFTKDGEFHPNTYGALYKIHENLFPEPVFLLVHKKHLVNIYNILEYDSNTLMITMDDENRTKIKIANKRKKEILQKLDKYFEGKNQLVSCSTKKIVS